MSEARWDLASEFAREDANFYVTERTLWGSVLVTQPIVGLSNAEGPPVPIPNTEVKLCSADNTLRETAREDRSRPTSPSHTAWRPYMGV